MLDVLLLSILQGIAEFLPISSSGHLVIAKHLLGLGETGIRLDVFLHLGTLVAVFAFYFSIVRRLATDAFVRDGRARASWIYISKILLSAVPVGLVGVLLNDWLEAAFASPRMVGGSLLFTGLVLLATRFIRPGRGDVSWLRAMIMGLAQAVAIIPGVSRSGMTLVAARASGVESSKAAEFSFLMSAPPIAGAAILEIKKGLAAGASAAGTVPETGWLLCLVGAAVAAFVGYFSLKLLLRSLQSDKFWLFGPYALVVGALALGCW